MKYFSYILGVVGWLAAAIIFRYGLYPPQIMFWLVSTVVAFITAGLAQDKWIGVRINLGVWVLMPIAQFIYPGKLPTLPLLLFFMGFNLSLSFLLGIVASKFKPQNLLKLMVTSTVILTLLITGLYVNIEKAAVYPSVVEKSDAAIILGAAVWEGGRPSPSMSARVKEGVNLYKQDLVEKLIVTGGLGRIPPTEAEVMANLAQSLGVAEADILLEKQASTTEENLAYSKQIGQAQGFNSYLVVTDAFHLKRALLIADSLEIKAQGIPALESPLYTNKWLRFKYTLRETFALVKFYCQRGRFR